MAGLTIVLMVDRDDDVGVKTGLRAPIIGRENCLSAALALGTADPEEADANAIMGAIKAYDQLKSEGECEIAIVTGSPEGGLKADKVIKVQMDKIRETISFTDIVLVSDGVEDEAVLPLLMSYAPIRSVVRVVVKHSQNIEESYIVLGKYLKMALFDIRYSRYFLGIPGLILIIYSILYFTPVRDLASYLILLIIGLAFIVKGFNLDNAVSQMRRSPNFLLRFLTAISSILITAIGAIKVAELISLTPQFVQIQQKFTAALLGYLVGYSIINIEPYIWTALALILVVNTAVAARRSRVTVLRELSLFVALFLYYIPFFTLGLLLMNPKISAIPLIAIILSLLATAFIVIYYIFDYWKSRN
ncbi:MAG: DUF373 family protein [Nitrososphaerota archaeon]|nr:DUF373 family protein [Nitrososphaerota archaeon]MDG6935847.1 DUF373 family protein [Nitrososphaerota archaeon]MDG6944168.1 DUF373 family protein [Nitrososphaerota archaeon]